MLWFCETGGGAAAEVRQWENAANNRTQWSTRRRRSVHGTFTRRL